MVVAVDDSFGDILLNIFNDVNLKDSTQSVGRMSLQVDELQDEDALDVEILDFSVVHVNEGYGTALMHYLFEYLDQQKYDQVHLFGKLAQIDEIDSNNCARRNHLYQKFDFEFEGRHISRTIITKRGRRNS